MREAKIILPTFDNAGNEMSEAHAQLKAALLRNFGGYTQSIGVGAWHNPSDGEVYNDHLVIYTVAMHDWHAYKLTLIAEHMISITDQECIYTVLPNGDVYMVERGMVAANDNAYNEEVA